MRANERADERMAQLSTGPFARPLARSLAPLTHSLAPHCLLRSRAPLRSIARSITRSRAHGKEVRVYGMNVSFMYYLVHMFITKRFYTYLLRY